MTVTDNKAEHRYELRDGDEVVGFIEYHVYGDELAFLHTEVKPERGGHGLGTELITAALGDARARGLRVLPYCPFVRDFVTKHAEYQDLVPDTHKAMFEL